MRLCAIVVAMTVLAGGVASAQEQPAAVGVKAGMNFANLNFEGDGATVNLDQRKGFVGGLFVVWPATSRVALQTEALYSQKGAQMEEEGASAKIKLDYVDVPVLARFSSPVSGGTSFHVFAGPSFNFRVSAKAESSFEDEDESEDIDDDVERFDLGFVAGAGLEFGRFVVDGRYTWGLSNINKDESEDVKIKNRVFAVMAGIRF
jgi:opacity protein-like surface antigen